MKLNQKNYLRYCLVLLITVVALPCVAEDWTISAYASCQDSLGTTISSGGGIKAQGGTAVVNCPLTHEVGTDTINYVYARMKRISATGADPFCVLNTNSNYGTPSASSYGYAADNTNNQSVSIPISTQYTSGYAYVLCVLNEGDILYGLRYIQDN